MPDAPKTSRSGRRSRPDAATDSARQYELLDIAASLFAQYGYNATTVRDIADAAGILSGSLYHHFTSKEAMADAILSKFLESMLERYEEIVSAGYAPRRTIEELVTASMLAMDTQRDAIVIYQNESRYLSEIPSFDYLRDTARRFREIWVGALRDGVEAGVLREEIDPRLVYRFIRDTIWNAARWYQPDGPVSAQEMTDQYLRMVLDGIAVRRAPAKRRASASS